MNDNILVGFFVVLAYFFLIAFMIWLLKPRPAPQNMYVPDEKTLMRDQILGGNRLISQPFSQIPSEKFQLQLGFLGSQPVFVSGENTGRGIQMCFGIWRVDDFFFENFYYFIAIEKRNDSWTVVTLLDVRIPPGEGESDYPNFQYEIEWMVDEINKGLENHEEVDFSSLLQSFHRQDSFFNFGLLK